MFATGILAGDGLMGEGSAAAEVGNDQLGKKFSKVNIVKIHFLPAIRSHSSSLASVSCGRFYRLSLFFSFSLSLFFNSFLRLLHPRPNTIIPATRIRKR